MGKSLWNGNISYQGLVTMLEERHVSINVTMAAGAKAQ